MSNSKFNSEFSIRSIKFYATCQAFYSDYPNYNIFNDGSWFCPICFEAYVNLFNPADFTNHDDEPEFKKSEFKEAGFKEPKYSPFFTKYKESAEFVEYMRTKDAIKLEKYKKFKELTSLPDRPQYLPIEIYDEPYNYQCDHPETISTDGYNMITVIIWNYSYNNETIELIDVYSYPGDNMFGHIYYKDTAIINIEDCSLEPIDVSEHKELIEQLISANFSHLREAATGQCTHANSHANLNIDQNIVPHHEEDINIDHSQCANLWATMQTAQEPYN